MTKNPYFLPERNPANCARQLLSNTVGYNDFPIDIFSIPEKEDINIVFCNEKFQKDTEYGITEITEYDEQTIYLNSDFYGYSFEEVSQNPTKRRHCRFTLAHELGHCTIPEHKDYYLQEQLLDEGNIHAKKYYYQREYEANVFAAELLIPSITIDNIYSYGGTFKQIIDNLSNKYDASLLASALKAASLMEDSCCICLQINPDTKKIVNLQYSKAFGEYKRGLYISRGSEIYSNSIAGSLIRGNFRSEYQKYTDPKDWFPGFYGSDEAELHEWSFLIGDNIITFLELIDTSEYKLHF